MGFLFVYIVRSFVAPYIVGSKFVYSQQKVTVSSLGIFVPPKHLGLPKITTVSEKPRSVKF